MPIVFSCAQCQEPLRAPDGTEGRQVRCPGCQAIATVPAGTAPAEPPAAPWPAPPPPVDNGGFAPAGTGALPPVFSPIPDAPSVRPPRFSDAADPYGTVSEPDLGERDPGWKTVKLGLRFVGFSALAAIGALAIIGILGYIGLTGGGLDGGPLAIAGLLMIGFLVIAVGLLIAGEFMCAAVPKSTGQYPIALAAAICTATLCLSPVGFILFAIFYHGVATRCRNPALGTWMIVYVVVTVLVFLAGCGLKMALDSGTRISTSMLVTILVAEIGTRFVLLACFFVLMNSLEGAITRSQDRASMD